MTVAATLPSAARGEFLAPSVTLVGAGVVGSVGEALRTRGVPGGPALVVADRVVAEAGLLERLLDGFETSGFTPHVFDGVAGEPDAAVVDRAGARARDVNAEAVVGIGGGSALDAAKSAALLNRNTGGITEWLGPVVRSNGVTPLALVPTTSGTGSETTRISMVTVGGVKRIVSCPAFVPVVAALDPDLVVDLPSPVVAFTGMDALAHAVESMLSENRTPLTLTAATQAAELLLRHLEAAFAGERRSREHVLYAAYLAGLGLNAGVVVGHSLAYVIARRQPLPHGTTCALALPYCLAYGQGVTADIGAHLATLLTGGASRELGDAAEAVRQLSARLGLPGSLADVGIDASQLSGMAAETVRDYPRPNNPVPLDEQRLETLLQHMHAGDVGGACLAMRHPQ